MSDWVRVSKKTPCPVCSRPDWCTLSADGSAACCMRVESPKMLRNGGYLHRLRDDTGQPPRYTARVTIRDRPAFDFDQLARQYEQAATEGAVERLALEFGVSVGALRRLTVGWDGNAWTFPMRDVGHKVTGIRRRFPSGKKLSVKDSRDGLFVPEGLPDTGLIVVTEGATDTAAMLTLGIDAIGRPSCSGGAKLLAEFCRGRPVVILADGDEPGRIGALVLAVGLRLFCPSVRVIRPPVGAKDARVWVQRGGKRQDVETAIAAAEPLGLDIKTSRRLALNRRLH